MSDNPTPTQAVYTHVASTSNTSTETAPSRTGSPPMGEMTEGVKPKERKNVKWGSEEPKGKVIPKSAMKTKMTPAESLSPNRSRFDEAQLRNITNIDANKDPMTAPAATPEKEQKDPFDDAFTIATSPIAKLRPSVLRLNSYQKTKEVPEEEHEDGIEDINEKTFSALAAQDRARRVATLVGSNSAPGSRRNSVEDIFDEDYDSPTFRPGRHQLPVRIDDIPLVEMDRKRLEQGEYRDFEDEETALNEYKHTSSSAAHKLVRAHTRKNHTNPFSDAESLQSGTATPAAQRDAGSEWVPKPTEYRGGVLSSLLKLYNPPPGQTTSGSPSQTVTPGSSGYNTPSRPKAAKWYDKKNQGMQSTDTLSTLVGAASALKATASPGMAGAGYGGRPGSRPVSAAESRSNSRTRPARPGMPKRTFSSQLMDTARGIGKPRLEDEIRITVHIAEVISRHKYLVKLCRGLMDYGAPTHRLEEYMTMSARVLEIKAQFLFIPGCMIISFDDESTHTAEVKLVRTAGGVDLGKLKDVHEIYKEVVHDVIGVEEATQRLVTILGSEKLYPVWLRVLMFGFGAAAVGPYAFAGRLVDMPIAFIIGCIVGFLQLVIAPKNVLWRNVFEVVAAIISSFLSRAFGSISSPKTGDPIFCFSNLAQSSIALILPGYLVLCGALELQSQSIVAGSVRMVYAIIYTLFLGYGMTIGTTLFGLMYSAASSETTCRNPTTDYYKWPFVFFFTIALCVINNAKLKQMPVMLGISQLGYIVNFFASKKFSASTQISGTFGAFAVGILASVYSRVRHGVAAAAMLPAIFVQVPSGLASGGSLLSGLTTANEITNTVTFANGTLRVNGTSITGSSTTSSTDSSVVLDVGFAMVQVAIGLSVGLFLSAIVMYPTKKRRSGLFTF